MVLVVGSSSKCVKWRKQRLGKFGRLDKIDFKEKEVNRLVLEFQDYGDLKDTNGYFSREIGSNELTIN